MPPLKTTIFKANFFVCTAIFGLFVAQCHGQIRLEETPSIKIRKKASITPFLQALTLPQTATSCDCPKGNNRNPLAKLGCQHPDTAAVCKVVITQFDVAIIPERGEAIVLKDVEGSFLNGSALAAIGHGYSDDFFVSYSNIKGMTEDGKEVVVPSFGTTNPNQRANRDYVSIYNYLPNVSNTKIYAFELLAYNADNQMIFRQSYSKDCFDKNAMRPDAVRYVFREIKATHTSGFEVEINNFEIENINLSTDELLSSN